MLLTFFFNFIFLTFIFVLKLAQDIFLLVPWYEVIQMNFIELKNYLFLFYSFSKEDSVDNFFSIFFNGAMWYCVWWAGEASIQTEEFCLPMEFENYYHPEHSFRGSLPYENYIDDLGFYAGLGIC